MSDTIQTQTLTRAYWPAGTPRRIAVALTGLIAVFLAIKTMAYSHGSVIEVSDHVFRLVAFASLTVWMTLSMGISRRASATIMVLAFASFIELFVIPASGQSMGTLASANLGIVFAYCGMQLYWYRLIEKQDAESA